MNADEAKYYIPKTDNSEYKLGDIPTLIPGIESGNGWLPGYWVNGVYNLTGTKEWHLAVWKEDGSEHRVYPLNVVFFSSLVGLWFGRWSN